MKIRKNSFLIDVGKKQKSYETLVLYIKDILRIEIMRMHQSVKKKISQNLCAILNKTQTIIVYGLCFYLVLQSSILLLYVWSVLKLQTLFERKVKKKKKRENA